MIGIARESCKSEISKTTKIFGSKTFFKHLKREQFPVLKYSPGQETFVVKFDISKSLGYRPVTL